MSRARVLADYVSSGDELALKAPLASPTLTGTPLTTTASAATNTTQIASTAFVRTEVANLADSAPAALDTLNELAAALGDDAAFSTTVTNSIALKAPIASPTFTGNFTSVGIDDNADATAIVIASDELVTFNKNTRSNGFHSYYDSTGGTLAGYIGDGVNLGGGGGTNDLVMRSADKLLFSTNGNNLRMTIDGSGNVGMGGHTPTFTANTGLHLPDNFKIGFGSGGNSRPDFQIWHNPSATAAGIVWAAGNAADTVDGCINWSGHIGIGTDNPGNPLHIYKGGGNLYAEIETTDANAAGMIFKNSASEWQFYNKSTGNFTWYNSVGADIQFTPAGNVGIGIAPTQFFQVKPPSVARSISVQDTANGRIPAGSVWIGAQTGDAGSPEGANLASVFNSQGDTDSRQLSIDASEGDSWRGGVNGSWLIHMSSADAGWQCVGIFSLGKARSSSYTYNWTQLVDQGNATHTLTVDTSNSTVFAGYLRNTDSTDHSYACYSVIKIGSSSGNGGTNPTFALETY